MKKIEEFQEDLEQIGKEIECSECPAKGCHCAVMQGLRCETILDILNETEMNSPKTAKELIQEVIESQTERDNKKLVIDAAIELLKQGKYQEATDLLNTI